MVTAVVCHPERVRRLNVMRGVREVVVGQSYENDHEFFCDEHFCFCFAMRCCMFFFSCR